MAFTYIHKPTAQYLTGFDAAELKDIGDGLKEATISTHSRSADGQNCEFTTYTLTRTPMAFDDVTGHALYRLSDCQPRCPIDGHPQAVRV